MISTAPMGYAVLQLVFACFVWSCISSGISGPLSAADIPKFSIELTGPPPVFVPNVGKSNYTVTMSRFFQQMLPSPLPSTAVFGYGGLAKDSVTGEMLGYVQLVPGPTFEVTRYTGAFVTWVNNITGPHMFAVDPTIHWANPNNMEMPVAPFLPFPPGYSAAQSPIPLVTHLHGMETRSDSDGHPHAWFTSTGIHGPAFHSLDKRTNNSAQYYYPNQQPGCTLWYHDHALGLSRLNVLAGLAGFYIIRDSIDPIAFLLPKGPYDMPLVLQDRIFNTSDGSIIFPFDGVNPEVHPYWIPEYFGDVILVNGKAWPNMKVDRGQYMFRILDASNARFYNLSFVIGMELLPFTIIGSDGGYYRTAVDVTTLLISPAERYTVLVDFSNLANGTTVIMKNSANAPFPDGDPVDKDTTAIVMQFTVQSNRGFQPRQLPPLLNPNLSNFPSLPSPTKKRYLTLIEIINEASDNPLVSFLNGLLFDSKVSETPHVGATEEWSIIDLTEDAHPMHLHTLQFQLVRRQPLNVTTYLAAWEALNGVPPVTVEPQQLDPAPYFIGPARGPELIEQCWKDNVIVLPGEVTVIRVRFSPQDGKEYPFDATTEPGYIWHCHILDHEDNEMMRPFKLMPAVTGLPDPNWVTIGSSAGGAIVFTLIVTVIVVIVKKINFSNEIEYVPLQEDQ